MIVDDDVKNYINICKNNEWVEIFNMYNKPSHNKIKATGSEISSMLNIYNCKGGIMLFNIFEFL